MTQNMTMASQIGKIDMTKVPLRSFSLRSLSTANKISLKEKLTAEVALVRSTIDKIGRDIPRTEQCCKRASINTTHSSRTKQQQVPATRKRKSSEITQVVKNVNNVNGISDVTHLHSHANPNKVLSKEAIYIMSPTKALRAAKLKSRFADTILKAQLELQNIGLKERAFRMQREKNKLTQPYNEEKLRIEAQINAAADDKKKSELRMKIKKEREASCLALEKMEATVETNNFNQIMKELKELGCQNISFYVLRQLGLFLKDDDCDDYQTAQISNLTNEQIEEGEICV